MKRKYREAMRAADALKHYDDAAVRRTLWPPKPPEAMGEAWCPVMTEQESAECEQRIEEFDLPF